MPWLFGKKDKKIDDDIWMIKKGQEDERQLFIRVRKSKPKNLRIEKYPHLIGISWEYGPRDESGLPDSLALEKMGMLEEILDGNYYR